MWRTRILVALFAIPFAVCAAVALASAIEIGEALEVPDITGAGELQPHAGDLPVWNGGGLLALDEGSLRHSRLWFLPWDKPQANNVIPVVDALTVDGPGASVLLSYFEAHVELVGSPTRTQWEFAWGGEDEPAGPGKPLEDRLSALVGRQEGWLLMQAAAEVRWRDFAAVLNAFHASPWQVQRLAVGASSWPHGRRLCIPGALTGSARLVPLAARVELTGGYFKSGLMHDDPLVVQLVWAGRTWSIPDAQNYGRRGTWGPPEQDVFVQANVQWASVRGALEGARAAGRLEERVGLAVDARTPLGPVVKAVDLFSRAGVREFEFQVPNREKLVWAVEPATTMLPIPNPAVRPQPLAPWWPRWGWSSLRS